VTQASPSGDGPVAFVGDSHLLARDEAITVAFVRFLESCPGRFERLVLVGDIFDLWLARPHLHEDHHQRVLAAVRETRARGLQVDYVVGNRDFGVETLPDSPFSSVATELLLGTGDQPTWLAEHGDLVNDDDAQYRRWRALARSPLVLGVFLSLPGVVGIPVSQWLERRMRTTNLAYKRQFPTAHALRHAAGRFAATGARHLVLGHFHQELRLEAPGGDVIVLPDWKRAKRHAEWHPGKDGGRIVLADST
jgi:UDP-2,3-diacylglucosamine hydrolase